ncbi:Hypothetical protein WEOB_145 [Candidatus Westeberhardia cardiocondylae]|uniref:Uncharacterized protein n=1 Tax=Candidatus Westeberhardia cardiocondylae TaxID=1594731 RepID=A0A0H5BWQ1_9ENTR|nr:hypothetical protein [Candidatus Westeberhardia cardiocondylae]CEN32098.1 Hypothetical protein WEOB_145 [Candidatus Westeberhardia cardiocondylae]
MVIYGVDFINIYSVVIIYSICIFYHEGKFDKIIFFYNTVYGCILLLRKEICFIYFVFLV